MADDTLSRDGEGNEPDGLDETPGEGTLERAVVQSADAAVSRNVIPETGVEAGQVLVRDPLRPATVAMCVWAAVALGLFAVFGIIRYRTTPIPIREMTYLFVIIGISVKNALVSNEVGLFRTLFADSIIIMIIWGAQNFFVRKKMIRKSIVYKNMELLKPDRYEDLLRDLSSLSGFPVEKAQVGRVDYAKGQARLRIFFYEKNAPHNYSDDDD